MSVARPTIAGEAVDGEIKRVLPVAPGQTSAEQVSLAGARLAHPMFLRWVVLQSLVATILIAGGLAYGHRLSGASLVMVPLILAVLVASSCYAGVLAWRLDTGALAAGSLRHLWFTAGLCQLLGLLGTVAGFYAMFNDGATPGNTQAGSDLATRVTRGAGVALSATFVGILSSIVILLEHHVLDREQ